jgi:hypothetical protein
MRLPRWSTLDELAQPKLEMVGANRHDTGSTTARCAIRNGQVADIEIEAFF